jgi:hypothetical protein
MKSAILGAPAAPASQLAAMSGVSVAASQAIALPTSQAGQYVRADVKGGDAQHAFRVGIIRTAVLESLKGNGVPMAEALDQAEGKRTIAVCYRAGIAAIGELARLDRAGDVFADVVENEIVTGRKLLSAGKWADADNKAVRADAETLADAAAVRFDSAFTTCAKDLKEQAKADKASKAAEKAAADALAVALVKAANDAPLNTAGDDAGSDAGAGAGSIDPDTLASAADQASVMRAAALATVLDAIKQGMLSGPELEAINAALDSVALGIAYLPVTEAAAPELAVH